MNKQFETVPCLVCGGENYQLKYKVPDRFRLGDGNIHRIVCCTECGFVYLNPRPVVDIISEYYKAGDYQPFLSTQESLNFWDNIYNWIRAYSVRAKRHKIERIKSTGRVLDVGCGTGEFLHEMKNHGWEVEGIEQDKSAAEYAMNKYGLNISAQKLNNKFYLKKSFDVITFWHVLEHLFNPVETLTMAKEIITEDGLILIAVPNVASYDAQCYQNYWIALDAPRHLYHFTPTTLHRLCRNIGLDVIQMQQMTLDAFYNCLMSEWLLISSSPMRKVILPLFFFRAFVIAKISLMKSTRLRTRDKRLGSSILYFIQKQKEC